MRIWRDKVGDKPKECSECGRGIFQTNVGRPRATCGAFCAVERALRLRRAGEPLAPAERIRRRQTRRENAAALAEAFGSEASR